MMMAMILARMRANAGMMVGMMVVMMVATIQGRLVAIFPRARKMRNIPSQTAALT